MELPVVVVDERSLEQQLSDLARSYHWHDYVYRAVKGGLLKQLPCGENYRFGAISSHIIPSSFFRGKSLTDALKLGKRFRWSRPPAEVIFRLRELINEDDIDQLGFRKLILMHRPIVIRGTRYLFSLKENYINVVSCEHGMRTHSFEGTGFVFLKPSLS